MQLPLLSEKNQTRALAILTILFFAAGLTLTYLNIPRKMNFVMPFTGTEYTIQFGK